MAQPRGSRQAVRITVILEAFRLARLVIWFLGLMGLTYVGIVLPIRATAGQITTVQVLLGVVGQFRLHIAIPYALAAAIAGLWYRERRTRKTAVDREHRRVVELEAKLDPNRTSSGLNGGRKK